MGTVAPAFVAAFLGPNGNGSNADGSPYSPAPVDAAGLGQAIDNAIPNAQDLGALTAEVTENSVAIQSLETNVQSLAGNVGALNADASNLAKQVGEADASIDALAKNVGQLNGTASDLTVAQQALQQQADASTAAIAPLSDRLDTLGGVGASLAALRLAFGLLSRPGDAPDAFTTDLTAGRSGVPTNAAVVVGPNGRALRLPGAFVLAPVALCALEPNRTYKLRAALRCSTDTTDPAGDAIRFAAAWYDASGNQLASLPLSDLATQRLTVAMGRAVYEAVVSLNPPAAPTDPYVRPVLQIPSGAAYCRPALIGYGATPVTDVEVLASVDITDSGAVSVDVDSINARVSAIAAALNLSI